MATPTRREILDEAEAMYMQDEYAATGQEPTKPEEHELKESGYYAKAQRKLMKGEASEARAAEDAGSGREETRELYSKAESKISRSHGEPDQSQGSEPQFSTMSQFGGFLGMVAEPAVNRVKQEIRAAKARGAATKAKKEADRALFRKGREQERRRLLVERGRQTERRQFRGPPPRPAVSKRLERASGNFQRRTALRAAPREEQPRGPDPWMVSVPQAGGGAITVPSSEELLGTAKRKDSFNMDALVGPSSVKDPLANEILFDLQGGKGILNWGKFPESGGLKDIEKMFSIGGKKKNPYGL